MKGIVRKIDELGRVVLPKEYRDMMGLNAGDRLSMEMISAGTITVKPVKTICIFCGHETTSTLAGQPCCGWCRSKVVKEVSPTENEI